MHIFQAEAFHSTKLAYPIEGVSNCVECAQEFAKDIEIAEHFGIHHGRLEKFIKKEGYKGKPYIECIKAEYFRGN